MAASTEAVRRPFTCDVHTHILPESWPDLKARYGYGGWVKLQHTCEGSARMFKDDGTPFRDVSENAWSLRRRLLDCDSAGVDVHVLSTVPVMFSYWAQPRDCLDLCEMLNDHVAACVASNPARFVGLGTLPMQSPELACQELRRCVKELGLAGVQIGTHVNSWTLDREELFPVFALAEELGCAIFVHPWDMMGGELMQKYWLSWLVAMPAETSLAICSLMFGGVLERLPRLRVCFAHGGGSFPGTVGRIQHGFDVRPDLCAGEQRALSVVVFVRRKMICLLWMVWNTRVLPFVPPPRVQRYPRAVDCCIPPIEQVSRVWVDTLVHDKNALDLVVKVFGEDKVVLGANRRCVST